MEILTEPAKKYVDSDIKFKLKLPAYETRRVEGTFLDEEGTKQDGKTLITYKGNTSQEGTPTPSSPIDVNVVTGENKVVVSNKNLAHFTYYANNNSAFINTNNSSLTRERTQSFLLKEYGIQYNQSYVISGLPSGWSLLNLRLYTEYNGTDVASSGNNYTRDGNVFSIIDTSIKYMYLLFGNNNSTEIATQDFYSANIQLEKGSTATDYIQHQEQSYEVNLGTIELCKIGTYQDKIYRQNGTWYLHKEVGKKVLNGTETILNNTSVGTNTRYIIGYTGVTNVQALCNQYKYLANYTNDSEHFYFSSNQIIIFDSENNDVAFRNKITTNKPEFYYILSTPTDTEITNQALISQLEYIKNNLKTYEEETIISQLNSDLPFYLDVLMEI